MNIEFPPNQLFIGGIWQKGHGAEIHSTFSADGSENCIIHGASLDDTLLTIERAKKAQLDPNWQSLKPFQRAKYLYNIAQLIENHAEHISCLQSRDTGKTLSETTALAHSAAATFRYYGAVLETTNEELTSQRGDYLTYSTYEPLGIIGAITPWNSPIASDAQKTAPALAAGNAVILKPSSFAPLVSLYLAKLIEKSGLPKGLFSVLPGSGQEVGKLLAEHSDIAKISFTGGTNVGRQLAMQAAQKLMPISLELGGKSPTIVFDDADINIAIAGVLFGIFSSSGQSCIAGSRLFVQSNLYESFVDQLVETTNHLKVGHPFEAATQVAPLINFKHRQTVEDYVSLAQQEGGQILTGGQRPDSDEHSQGAYYMPTIIGNLNNQAKVCREEIFGPVLVVIPFEDEDDVIAQSNDNEYGLACGIWSKDFNKSWRVAKAIRAGTVWINTYKQFSISTPFGGEGESGLGREKGLQGLRAYMKQKSIYYDLSEKPHAWANNSVE